MVYPENWLTYDISDLCITIVDCLNRTAPTVPHETPYKMIRTTNVRNGLVNLSSVRYVEAETFEKWTRRQVPARGDIVLTREAPLGEVGMISSDEKVFLGQRTVGYRINPKKADANFVLYAMQSHNVQSQFRAFGSGSTVEHIRVPDCKIIKITAPELPIQKRIAGILSAYDDLIAVNTRRIEALEEMARRSYEEWIRINSKQLLLGDVIDIRKGKNITKKTIRPGAVPVVAGGMKPAYFHDTSNTVGPTITVSASGANAGYVKLYFQDLWASDCSYVDTRASEHIYFIYLTLISRQAEIFSMQRGTAQPHVYPKDLDRLEIRYPRDEASLTIFTEKVTPLFDFQKNLHQQNTNLRAQRDLLLPRLISGEIDVSDAPTPISEAAE